MTDSPDTDPTDPASGADPAARDSTPVGDDPPAVDGTGEGADGHSAVEAGAGQSGTAAVGGDRSVSGTGPEDRQKAPAPSAGRAARWLGFAFLTGAAALILVVILIAVNMANGDDNDPQAQQPPNSGRADEQPETSTSTEPGSARSTPDQTLVPEGLPYIPPKSNCTQDLDKSVARTWNEEVLEGIRRSFPNPPVHARNLYHLSAAMWDAWAAYSPDAQGLFVDEDATATDIEAARNEAISYAAFRVIADRYATSWGAEDTMLEIAQLMANLCYDAELDTVVGTEPYAVGNRIAETILSENRFDGSNELDGYKASDYDSVNPPLKLGQSGTAIVDPDHWQPLEFDVPAKTQHGQALSSQLQTAVGPHWGHVTPFAITPDPETGNPMDPPGPPLFADPATRPEYVANAVEVIRYSATLGGEDNAELIDVSPGARGNNSLGENDGTGHPVNPSTGEPYEPLMVPAGDFGRVAAEYWADGPRSETPPGHWNTIANMVSDSPDLERRIGGVGPEVDQLEWDVKLYVALNGATHDAAIGAWGSKGFFDSVRPISMIRFLCENGQSSDPSQAGFNPEGITLEDGLIEVITSESSAPGERHEKLADHVGEIAVRAWGGYPKDVLNQQSGVEWILGVDWVPYQQQSFVTPAFPGYVSGHSTFSRSAAEVLAGITGSEYFPGGMASTTYETGQLEFEAGPADPVTLEWATFFDASDQAGQSRLYGGIHIPADDRDGRIMGSEIGKTAWARAQQLWTAG